MATITVTNTLDVSEKYETLVKQSLGGNSVYIRAKETIEELFASGSIANSDKAQVISNVVGGLVNSIATASMGTALEWAKAEKEIELEKLRLTWQLDTLEQESLLAASQVAQSESGTRLAKVESRRIHGVGTFDVNDNLVSLDNSGKSYAEIQMTDASTAKVVQEELLTTQKIDESFAAVHKIIADTYVNYGSYTYTTLASNGVSGVAPQHGVFVTLSDTQQSIAEQQAKGYTYNAWANALTGSSSMLGTAIAAEYAEFGEGTTGGDLLATVLETANNLKNATVPT